MKENKRPKLGPVTLLIVFCLAVFDCVGWYLIFSGAMPRTASAYFLDVGQGDSEIIVFSNGVRVMTDAGPDNSVVAGLANVLPPEDAYIDVAVISHPQADHFGGYTYLLDHYRIGAFIYNGRDDASGTRSWFDLVAKIKEKHIPLITLGIGDSIRSGQNEIDILSPDADFVHSAELNDTGLVEMVKTPGLTALLTADTGANVESFLLAHYADIHADILKVGHHGSNYASSDPFLKAVDPEVAVIEVGAKNTYGQPGKDTLARLASSTKARVFRTDRNGTVEFWVAGGQIRFREVKG